MKIPTNCLVCISDDTNSQTRCKSVLTPIQDRTFLQPLKLFTPDFCAVCADAQVCANDDKKCNLLIINNSMFFAQGCASAQTAQTAQKWRG